MESEQRTGKWTPVDLSQFDGITGGEWFGCHFTDPESKCQCRYVLCERFMGSIATIDAKNSEPNNDDPPIDEARANARAILAVPGMVEALGVLQPALQGIDDPARYRRIADAAMALADIVAHSATRTLGTSEVDRVIELADAYRQAKGER